MNLMEFSMMSDEAQEKWISEHSDKEIRILYDEYMENMRLEIASYRIDRSRERRKMCEISYAILKGNYSGVTSDGKSWKIDFSDHHVDDWRDQYYPGDYD